MTILHLHRGCGARKHSLPVKPSRHCWLSLNTGETGVVLGACVVEGIGTADGAWDLTSMVLASKVEVGRGWGGLKLTLMKGKTLLLTCTVKSMHISWPASSLR